MTDSKICDKEGSCVQVEIEIHVLHWAYYYLSQFLHYVRSEIILWALASMMHKTVDFV